jgi:maleylacetate reductase
MPSRFNYTKLEEVVQHAQAAEELSQQVEKRGSKRVFIIISQTLKMKSEVIEEISSLLGERVAGVFSDIPAHTPRPAVMVAIDAARKANADLLVSIGGGSVIDAAKVVQLALTLGINSEQELTEYAQFADGSRGAKAGDMSLFNGPSTLRQIAIPTTLSGAEFSNNAGVTDVEKSLKEGYRGTDLCPISIIYDPELALLTPQWLWLSTAIRSLDHAVEGYCSADTSNYLDGHFLHAMKLFASSLPATVQDPNDLEARSLNQQAVWLACCGLGQVAHGASHGIGYLLGAVCGVPHGYTSCVMLPAALTWNEKVNEKRQISIAEALGYPDLRAAEVVKNLIKNLQLPTSLQEVGVKKEQLETIAQLAYKHPVVRKNPRLIDSANDVMEILELAWE